MKDEQLIVTVVVVAVLVAAAGTLGLTVYAVMAHVATVIQAATS